MNQSVERLNQLSGDDVEAELRKCCGSTRWAHDLAGQRPFASLEQIYAKGDEIWWSLSEEDWLEAFRAHPKIGERKAATAQSQQAQSWSAQEQSGVANAAAETQDELGRLNREYEDRFGFIFIVCASGKTSEELLAILQSRIGNDRSSEIRVAAEEQRKITRLRLEKLLNQ